MFWQYFRIWILCVINKDSTLSPSPRIYSIVIKTNVDYVATAKVSSRHWKCPRNSPIPSKTNGQRAQGHFNTCFVHLHIVQTRFHFQCFAWSEIDSLVEKSFLCRSEHHLTFLMRVTEKWKATNRVFLSLFASSSRWDITERSRKNTTALSTFPEISISTENLTQDVLSRRVPFFFDSFEISMHCFRQPKRKETFVRTVSFSLPLRIESSTSE